MKTIQVGYKHLMIVDDDDYDRINDADGSLDIARGYVFLRENKGRRKRTPISRFILRCEKQHRNQSGQRLHVDHINGNTLDNRKENLRLVPVWVNAMNRHGKRKNNKSGHSGVHWEYGGWAVRVGMFGKAAYLGRFKTLEEAISVREAFVSKMLEDPASNRVLPSARNTNKSGFVGVYWQPKSNRWVAFWSQNGKQVYRSYLTKQEAIDARKSALDGNIPPKRPFTRWSNAKEPL